MRNSIVSGNNRKVILRYWGPANKEYPHISLETKEGGSMQAELSKYGNFINARINEGYYISFYPRDVKSGFQSTPVACRLNTLEEDTEAGSRGAIEICELEVTDPNKINRKFEELLRDGLKPYHILAAIPINYKSECCSSLIYYLLRDELMDRFPIQMMQFEGQKVIQNMEDAARPGRLFSGAALRTKNFVGMLCIAVTWLAYGVYKIGARVYDCLDDYLLKSNVVITPEVVINMTHRVNSLEQRRRNNNGFLSINESSTELVPDPIARCIKKLLLYPLTACVILGGGYGIYKSAPKIGSCIKYLDEFGVFDPPRSRVNMPVIQPNMEAIGRILGAPLPAARR